MNSEGLLLLKPFQFMLVSDVMPLVYPPHLNQIPELILGTNWVCNVDISGGGGGGGGEPRDRLS